MIICMHFCWVCTKRRAYAGLLALVYCELDRSDPRVKSILYRDTNGSGKSNYKLWELHK